MKKIMKSLAHLQSTFLIIFALMLNIIPAYSQEFNRAVFLEMMECFTSGNLTATDEILNENSFFINTAVPIHMIENNSHRKEKAPTYSVIRIYRTKTEYSYAVYETLNQEIIINKTIIRNQKTFIAGTCSLMNKHGVIITIPLLYSMPVLRFWFDDFIIQNSQ